MSVAPSPARAILALSGGTGGAKLLDGLAQAAGQEALGAVVNTGDDADFYGLRVCPDLDICTYTLAGVVAERGWGYAGDSFRCLEGLATYGHEAWFGLGDRDLATHIHRTLRLGEGMALSAVTAELSRRRTKVGSSLDCAKSMEVMTPPITLLKFCAMPPAMAPKAVIF